MANLSYETTHCGRCGGSGRYSYCQMYGDTCFKCGGSGKALSRKGAAARAKVEAMKTELAQTLLATELQPGMVVKSYDNKYRTLVAVNTESATRYGEPGATVAAVELTFKNNHRWAMHPNTRLTLQLTVEAVGKLVAYAKTLKGATVKE